MARAQDTIAATLEASQKLLNRFLEDLTPQEYLHRAVPGSNCIAWMIGHLVLSQRRWLTSAGSKDLPVLPGGFEQQFARSEDAAKAVDFGDVSILRPLFNQHRQRVIEPVRSAPDESLDRPVGFTHPMFQSAGQAAAFSAIHVALRANLHYPPELGPAACDVNSASHCFCVLGGSRGVGSGFSELCDAWT